MYDACEHSGIVAREVGDMERDKIDERREANKAYVVGFEMSERWEMRGARIRGGFIGGTMLVVIEQVTAHWGLGVLQTLQVGGFVEAFQDSADVFALWVRQDELPEPWCEKLEQVYTRRSEKDGTELLEVDMDRD